jgi:triosephosphate isomerase (TIM)
MNLASADAVALASALKADLGGLDDIEVVVCPVFTVLSAVADVLDGALAVGGQNCYAAESGAYTGEISPQLLQDAGCTWVIVGHSERRQYFQESDAFLNEKLKFALDAGMRVMFCIGETLDERESGAMNEVLARQTKDGLAGLSEAQFDRVVLAYEPVWAIGTGVTASPEQAEEAHAFVRGQIAENFGATVADGLRIQYGGSVKPDNAAELMNKPNVDGALVGGASLKADSFSAIVKASR